MHKPNNNKHINLYILGGLVSKNDKKRKSYDDNQPNQSNGKMISAIENKTNIREV